MLWVCSLDFYSPKNIGYHPWQSIKGSSELDAVSGHDNEMTAGNI